MDNKLHNFDELIKKALAETDSLPATFDVNAPSTDNIHWDLFEQKLNNEQATAQHFDQICRNALQQAPTPKYNPKHWQLLEKELSTPNNWGSVARFDQIARTALQQTATKHYNTTHWLQMERLLNQKYYASLFKKIGTACVAAALLLYFYNAHNPFIKNTLYPKNNTQTPTAKTQPSTNNHSFEQNTEPLNLPTASSPSPAPILASNNNNNNQIKPQQSQTSTTSVPSFIPANIQKNNNFSLVNKDLNPLRQAGQAVQSTNLLNTTAQKQLPSFLLTQQNNTLNQLPTTPTAQNFANEHTASLPPSLPLNLPAATTDINNKTANENNTDPAYSNNNNNTNSTTQQQNSTQQALPVPQTTQMLTDPPATPDLPPNNNNNKPAPATPSNHATKSAPKLPYSLALNIKAGIYVGSDFSKAENTRTNGLRLGITNGIKANISSPKLKKWSADVGVGYAYQTVSYEKTDNVVQSKIAENQILIDTINTQFPLNQQQYQIDILSASSLYAASFSRFEIPLTVQFHYLNTKKMSLYAGAGLNTHVTLKKQYTQSQIGYINTIFKGYDTTLSPNELQNLISADAAQNTPNPYNGTMPPTSDSQKPQIAYKRMVNNTKAETKIEPKELVLNIGSTFKVDKKWSLDVRANVKRSISPYSFIESPYYQYKTETQTNITSYGWQLGILHNF